MVPRLLVLALAATAALVPSAILAAEDPTRADLEALNRKFSAAIARGDVAAVAAMYGGDAALFPPGAEVVRGGEGIRGLWQSFVDAGVKGLELTISDVERCGAFAHETGTYRIVGAEGKELDRGKYLVIWKREGRTWTIHRDIWNTSVAPAVGAAGD
jgi:ketosteroid isomerase-like protein